MQAHLPEAPENVQSGNQVSLAFKVTSDRLRRWRMLTYQSRSVSTGNRAGRSKASRNIFLYIFLALILKSFCIISFPFLSWLSPGSRSSFSASFLLFIRPFLNMYLFFFYFFVCYILLLLCMISWKKVSLQEITLTVLKVAVAHVVLNCEFGLVDQPVWTGKKWVIWICKIFCRLFSLTPWIF